MSWLEIWAMLQVLSLVVPLGIFTFIIVYFGMKAYIKELRCDHEDYYENMACHAICRNCRKDLGFIGTVREERAKK